eukprot:c16846_g1_i1 orf=319-870(-)
MKHSRQVQGSQKEKVHRQLRFLRSILPSRQNSISQEGWSSLILDAANYIEELRKQIQDLSSDIEAASTLSSLPSDFGQFSWVDSPTQRENETGRSRRSYVEVLDKLEEGLEIHISCVKRHGLLIAIMEALEGFGLIFTKVNIQCQQQLQFHAFGAKNFEGQFVETDMVRKVLERTILRTGDGA